MTDLDDLLRAADPTAVPPADRPHAPADRELLTAVWARVQQRIDPAPAGAARAPARRSPRRSRRVAAGLALALVGSGGAAVAADYLASRTGEQLSGWERDASGPGEVLRMDGTDYRQVVEEETRDIPFPDATYRDRALASKHLAGGEPDTAITTGAVRAAAAKSAICAWADTWAVARTSNPARAEQARAALQRSLTWPAVSAVDPSPSMTGYRNDQGLDTPTVFGFAVPVIEAVATDSVAGLVASLEQTGGCGPDQAPNLPWTDSDRRDAAAATLRGEHR